MMLCGKVREVDGITTTNGDMNDFEEGLALLVSEEKSDHPRRTSSFTNTLASNPKKLS